MAEITIRNPEDLQRVLQHIGDPEYLVDNSFVLDPQKEIRLRLVFEGEQFNQSVTTPILRGILEVQEAVYDLYKMHRGERYRLTAEDKKLLEMRVEFGAGSTIADLIFALDSFVRNMTGTQALVALGIVSTAWVAVSGLKELRHHKREQLETKLKEYESAQQTERVKELQETTRTQIGVLERLTSHMNRAYHTMAHADADRILIQDETYTPADLRHETRAVRPRRESVFRTVQGTFRIEQIDFSDEEETYVQARHTDSGELFRNVSVQKGQMSENDYNLLKDAYERDPVTMRVIVEERSGRIVRAYVDTGSVESGNTPSSEA